MDLAAQMAAFLQIELLRELEEAVVLIRPVTLLKFQKYFGQTPLSFLKQYRDLVIPLRPFGRSFLANELIIKRVLLLKVFLRSISQFRKMFNKSFSIDKRMKFTGLSIFNGVN